MNRFRRPLLRVGGIFVICFFLINTLPSIRIHNDNDAETATLTNTNETQLKYLSYFPHGDFFAQHEALRMAIRLGYETNRTVIIPKLRLGYPSLERGGFVDMVEQYERQGDACEQPCSWMEMLWSDLFDLEPLEREFGIRIIERLDHGWGPHESFLMPLQPEEVVPVEVVTSASVYGNPRTIWSTLVRLLPFQRHAIWPMRIHFLSDLVGLDARLIQLGTLSNKSFRRELRNSEKQAGLHGALTSRILVTPDRLSVITQTAQSISEALGGAYQYSVLTIRMRKLFVEDQQEKNMGEDSSDVSLDKDEGIQDRSLIEGYMKIVVLELLANLPIDQTVAAIMKVKPSKLASFLAEPSLHKHTTEGRSRLRDVCVEYRTTVDPSYPVVYLVSDVSPALEDDHVLWKPLRDIFPCMFTKADMLRWGKLSATWAQELSREGMAVEPMMAPILNVLVASKTYSFFEMPQTTMTNMISWQTPQNTTAA